MRATNDEETLGSETFAMKEKVAAPSEAGLHLEILPVIV
jgi:hypothetical protein